MKYLYRVRHQSWSNFIYVAASNQVMAAKLACEDTQDLLEKCNVEFVGDVIIEQGNAAPINKKN